MTQVTFRLFPSNHQKSIVISSKLLHFNETLKLRQIIKSHFCSNLLHFDEKLKLTAFRLMPEELYFEKRNREKVLSLRQFWNFFCRCTDKLTTTEQFSEKFSTSFIFLFWCVMGLPFGERKYQKRLETTSEALKNQVLFSCSSSVQSSKPPRVNHARTEKACDVIISQGQASYTSPLLTLFGLKIRLDSSSHPRRSRDY